MPLIPQRLPALVTACAYGLSLLAFCALQGKAQVNQSSSSRDDLAFLPDAPHMARQQPSGQSQGTSPAPAPASASPAPQNSTGPKQTKRILGIMPNFNAVSADTKLPPQSPKEKFVIAAKNSFDYSSFFIAAVQSGISMAGNSYPEFHQGVAGYGRYYYHTLLDTADENFMVAGLWPVVFHQDNRFYTMGHGRIGRRALYAASRVLITRNDSGNKTFNVSEILGAGSAASLSTVYYPDRYQTWTKVGQKWLTSCIIDSANFTFKEFWPDINRKLFHTK
jgi:hypothetical protein